MYFEYLIKNIKFKKIVLIEEGRLDVFRWGSDDFENKIDFVMNFEDEIDS